MSDSPHNKFESVHRRLRLVGILAAAAESGLTPLPAREVHAVAYFADALAPVWDLKVLDPRVLKQSDGPLSAPLQRELDWLVGRGVLVPFSVSHRADAEGNWRLSADYALNEEMAEPIVDAALDLPAFATEFQFLREVVFSMSGFGAIGISSASAADAAYGSKSVDFGNLVDVDPDDWGREGRELNPTTQVALRFGELMAPEVHLTKAEKVHLYVRELSRRLASS